MDMEVRDFLMAMAANIGEQAIARRDEVPIAVHPRVEASSSGRTVGFLRDVHRGVSHRACPHLVTITKGLKMRDARYGSRDGDPSSVPHLNHE